MSKSNPWELYQSVDGWEDVAQTLDGAVAYALAELDRSPHMLTHGAGLAFASVEDVMSRFADFGAMDTEPRWHLADRITKHLRTVHHADIRVNGYGDVEG